MSYQDDKRELLKLKQGIIEKSETIHEEEKPVYELHGRKKAENFLYHYKWHLVAGAFFAAVAIFLIVSLLAKEKADLRVLVVTKGPDVARNVLYKTKEFEEAFELYCPDFDKSGYIHVDVYNIDLSDNVDPQYVLANVTKATSEILYGEGMLFMMDTMGADAVSNGDLSGFVDLGELYPDNKAVNGIFLHVKETYFSNDAKYLEACPDDLYFAVRKVTDDMQYKERSEYAQRRSMQVIDNIINGKYEGWADDQGRIYGISSSDKQQ